MLEISDRATLDVELNAVAILPWLGRDGCDVAREIDLSDAAQHFAQRGNLLLHLDGVIQMLILTAAAELKIGARRRHARCGR